MGYIINPEEAEAGDYLLSIITHHTLFLKHYPPSSSMNVNYQTNNNIFIPLPQPCTPPLNISTPTLPWWFVIILRIILYPQIEVATIVSVDDEESAKSKKEVIVLFMLLSLLIEGGGKL